MQRSAHAPRFISTLCLSLLLAAVMSAQTYFPLSMGNRWTFRWFDVGSIYDPSDNRADTSWMSATAETLVVNSRSYYTLTWRTGSVFGYVSVDSATIRFWSRGDNLDYPAFDLTSHVGDTLVIQPYQLSILDRIDTIYALAESTIVRTYRITNGLSGEMVYRFSDKFGPFEILDFGGDPPPPWPTWGNQLLGCEFAGVKHGYTVGVADEFSTPAQATLLPNFPNPFNPATTIPFQIHQESDIRISIVNTLGQSIRLLFEGRFQAGQHSVLFDGFDDHRRQLSSGIYYVTLSTRTSRLVRPIALLR